jgi:hypothetical protein
MLRLLDGVPDNLADGEVDADTICWHIIVIGMKLVNKCSTVLICEFLLCGQEL